MNAQGARRFIISELRASYEDWTQHTAQDALGKAAAMKEDSMPCQWLEVASRLQIKLFRQEWEKFRATPCKDVDARDCAACPECNTALRLSKIDAGGGALSMHRDYCPKCGREILIAMELLITVGGEW